MGSECVALDDSLNLSEPQFLHLKMVAYNMDVA